MSKMKYALAVARCLILLYLPAYRSKYVIAITVCVFLFHLSALGQDEADRSYPRVGGIIPDYTFSDVQYYDKRAISLKDFRGKWVVLDFWERTCAGCIVAMPGLSQIKKELGDKVEVLLVGLNEKWVSVGERLENPRLSGNDYIRSLFKKIRERSDVELPVAWDTVLFKQFLGTGVPYVIIVDPLGVVRASTVGISKAELEELMAGKMPILTRYPTKGLDSLAKNYNPWIPLLVRGAVANGGVDTSFFYRDLLMLSNVRTPVYMDFRFYRGTFEVFSVPLSIMYKVAYTGTLHWDFTDSVLYGNYFQSLVFETKDSSELLRGKKYCYSLTLHKNEDLPFNSPNAKEKALFKKLLQRDLAVNFPYQVAIEDRPQDFYRLVVTDSSKISQIKSKGGVAVFNVRTEQVIARNVPMKRFLGGLLMRTRHASDYIANNSGILDNIDIILDANTGDIDDINRSLATFGLALQKSKKTMKTIVIMDRLKCGRSNF